MLKSNGGVFGRNPKFKTVTADNVSAPNLQGPAFDAYAGAATSAPQNTYTKIALSQEGFDTNACFADGRFTPTVPGYYLFTGGFFSFGANYCSALVFKNGSAASRGSSGYSNNSFTPYSYMVSCLLYMNGTTDYVELYCIQGNGTQNVTDGFLQGALIRSA